MKPLTSFTRKLDDAQADLLRRQLESRGYTFESVPYARFAAHREEVKVVFYESGKLVVQGKGTRDFVEFVLEPEVLKQVELGYESVLKPEILEPRLGVDESGKGDFFGPMCVAGVYVNAAIVKAWTDLGVRDSKAIGSDRKIAELAAVIGRTPGCVTSVVPIGNQAYNRLHAKLGTVNAILAWGHARVIENLLQREGAMQPPPLRAVSDQFAASKAVVARALMNRGKQLELVQRHRAEEDLAVAAASILARHEFVTRLAALGKQYGLTFPKGGGGSVDDAAKEFVRRHGIENLPKVAKVHFRNAARLMAAPEPNPGKTNSASDTG